MAAERREERCRGQVVPRDEDRRVGRAGRHVSADRCGIATYTASLRDGLEACGLDSRVLRLVDDTEVGSDTEHVVGHWVRTQPLGAAAAAAVVAPFDSVLVQHEFGIYPGIDGADVVAFEETCRPPVFTVFHTVLETPTSSQHRIIDALVQSSELVFVHTTVARTACRECTRYRRRRWRSCRTAPRRIPTGHGS